MIALGRARQAKGRECYDGDVNLPAFLTAKNLKPYIDNELYVTSSQVIFRTKSSFGLAGRSWFCPPVLALSKPPALFHFPMNAYLSLTLEEAKRIVASGERKHWVEARKAVALSNAVNWGKADDPDYVVVTFVHRFGASNHTAAKLKACTGQVIVVLARDHQRAPRLIWGKPLHSGDALLRDVQRNHILSTVRQPRA